MCTALRRTASNTLCCLRSTIKNSNYECGLCAQHRTGQQLTQFIMCSALYMTAIYALLCLQLHANQQMTQYVVCSAVQGSD